MKWDDVKNHALARLADKIINRRQDQQHLDLNFHQTDCSREGCNVSRQIPGLIMTGDALDHGKGRRILFLKVGLHELSEHPDTGLAWTHFGEFDRKMSDEVKGVQYKWQSRCDKPECSGYSVHADLAEAQGQINQEYANANAIKRMSPESCECGERRTGVEITIDAKFAGHDSPPIAAIRLYEANMLRDFSAPLSAPIPRFEFRGVLDRHGKRHWGMTCPECLMKRQKVLGKVTPLVIQPGDLQ
jgi:hypothetical protein